MGADVSPCAPLARRGGSRTGVIGLACAVLVGLGGCSPAQAQSGLLPSGTAAAGLAQLPVKPLASKIGYSRARFGQAWADSDRNGCDQRNDTLGRDLNRPTFRPATHLCVVTAGTLPDPYSGTTIAFRRGTGTSSTVQIDHVVAEGNAWQTGAQQLDPATRQRFATDLLNLLAVEGRLNEAKGDDDAAAWLPPAPAFRCRYVALQIAVKLRYHLWVTAPERAAMAAVLASCPHEHLPSTGGRTS